MSDTTPTNPADDDLRKRIALAIAGDTPDAKHFLDDADAALSVVAPVLEGLRAELAEAADALDKVAEERDAYRAELAKVREALQTPGGWATRMHALRVRQERDKASDEADRLHNEVERLRAEVEQWKATYGETALRDATAIIAERDKAVAELAELRAVLVEAEPKADLEGYPYVPSVEIAKAIISLRASYLKLWGSCHDRHVKAEVEVVRLRKQLDEERESRIAWALEADRLQQIADHTVVLPEDWREQINEFCRSKHTYTLAEALEQCFARWQVPSVSDQTPATPDDSHGVRRLIVHPATWDGLVRFLGVRGIEVTSYGNEDGIPTFGMGIKEFPAPSSVQGDTTPDKETDRG